MIQKNEKKNENPGLEAKRQAVLERLLKGKIPVDLKIKSIPGRQVFSPVPLSFAQKRLWVLDQLVPDSPVYNEPTVTRIDGALDLQVFERSINEMVRRHESLRTIFKMENEEPVQVILPELNLELNIIDLSGLEEPEKEKKISGCIEEEAGKPFDLARGPLLRVLVLVRDINTNLFMYNMHHIITDGWSIDLFAKELMIIYKAFLAGNPSPLPAPPLQYADFALWQREQLQGENLQKHLSYWKNIFSKDIPILELPADRQRPAISSFRGEKQGIKIPESLTVRLTELVRKQGYTMYMMMIAAFCVLLYRYSGQEDIMIGSPITNRGKPELEKIIGFFVNTIVIRCNLVGNPTFIQLLERVREIATSAYDNQDIPFEKLVEQLQPDRYMSHNPLFQVMIVLENISRHTASAGNKNTGFSNLDSHSGTSKFDLWLLIFQSEKFIYCNLEYSTDLFDSDRIMRLLRHFKNVLQAVAADPGQPIDDILYLAEEEKEQLLNRWNDTARQYDIKPLHDMFEAQVKKTPDHIAVNDPTAHISYIRLNEQSGRLAGRLKENGIQPGAVAGIQIERSVEMVVGLMGILKAGAAYLPIDPQLPPDRVEYILKDSGAAVLLTEAGDIKCLSGLSLLRPGTGTAQLAYIIYTSGSTGKPKGVMVNHEGISNRLQWMQEAFVLTANDRILQKTPYNFDVSVWEFFWTLSYGARLIMAQPGGHKDSAYLVKAINREKITTIHFVPTMLNVFLEDPGINSVQSLKRVICSGETLTVEYREKFFNRFPPGVELHNLYGPTEASVDVTHRACERNSSHHSVPIGKPIANTSIYILDRNMNIVPIGIPGEIHINGIQLARGYINRPELTAEKFTQPQTYVNGTHPLPNKKLLRGVQGGSFLEKSPPGRRRQNLYKTGDLARWSPGGAIEFIGRLDFQVKVRGFRIELGEIEANLRENHSVSDAVVLVTGNSTGANNRKLTAYVVPDTRLWKDGRHEETGSENLSAQQVTDWQDVFNDTYTTDGHSRQQNPAFNTAGWNSSYTGAPIPAEEMRLWVDQTVQRILSYQPRNVMEIGCGTGLFLFRIIPHCRRFLGTDIAQQGLNYINTHLEKIKETGWADVRTMCCSAENFDGIEAGELDMVILNSVVQYFPSGDYLETVLEKAAQKIKPGGHIFIGDVRSFSLLKTFHASVELSKAEPGTPNETILRRVLNKISLEQELVIDPLFFDTLKKRHSRIKHIEPLIKYGRYTNELSKFRYDIVLHIGSEDSQIPLIQPDPVLEWNREKTGIDQIREILSGWANKGSEPGCAIVTSVPNARVREDIRALKRLTAGGEPGNTRGIEPDDLLELEKDYPYHISLRVSPLDGEEGRFDAVFTHREKKASTPGAVVPHILLSPPPGETASKNSHTNNPLLVPMAGRLVPQLRSFLKEKLPEYMVPSYFVLLERLPMTSSGKLDRRTLPEPVRVEQTREFTAPSTKTEILLARLWKEILNLEKVSINHNFFELGGDSVNAIQVVSRARKQGVEISIQLLFRNQTIAGLAEAVEKSQHQLVNVGEQTYNEFMMSLDMEAILEQLPPGLEIEDIYPATPLQVHQVHILETQPIEDPPIYLYQKSELPVHMTLEEDKLDRAMQMVSQRHRMLRTLLIWKNLPEPVQVVCKELKFDFFYHDLTSIPPGEKTSRLYQLLKQDWNKTFKRNQSSPMRIGFFKLEENQYGYCILGDYMRMEGWSTGEFSHEILTLYGNLKNAAPVPPLPPHDNCYKEYVHTIRISGKKDQDPARSYWQSVFKDFSPMKSLSSIPGNQVGHIGQASGFGVSHLLLSPEISARMEQFLLEHRLSLSAFIQGTWAALLSIYLRQDRIVYGMMTTGRSVPIAGIEHMIGHSVNILPVAVQISREKPLLDYFSKILDFQAEWTRYEYTQVDRVYEWLDLSGPHPMFDHYIVIQNLASAAGDIRGMEKRKENRKTAGELIFAKMEYPLRFDIFPGYEYYCLFHHHLRFLTTPAVNGLKDNFKTLIQTIIENPRQTFEEWTKSVDTQKYKLYINESPDGFVQK